MSILRHTGTEPRSSLCPAVCEPACSSLSLRSSYYSWRVSCFKKGPPASPDSKGRRQAKQCGTTFSACSTTSHKDAQGEERGGGASIKAPAGRQAIKEGAGSARWGATVALAGHGSGEKQLAAAASGAAAARRVVRPPPAGRAGAAAAGGRRALGGMAMWRSVHSSGGWPMNGRARQMGAGEVMCCIEHTQRHNRSGRWRH
jgi:hypothetical protein